MAILGCDFLAFHGLQLDFTEMLLVDPHVIGSHDERVIQGSRLNNAEERFPPQPSINEVHILSLTRDTNVLPAEKTATTDIGVGSIGQAGANNQYGITRQHINTCEQGDVTCTQDVWACEQAITELPIASDSPVITTACNPASDVRVEAKPSLSSFPQPPSNHLPALCDMPQPLQSCTVHATTSAPIDPIVKNNVLRNEIFSTYPGAFEPTLTPQPVRCNIEHHVITSGPPVVSRVRRLSPERLAFVKKEIRHLLESGIVVPSSSPYASPIHIVPKQKPGDFRMVGDYRALNNVTQPDRYPLPYLADFVDIAQGCTIFSKLDCHKGYHQIPVAKQDQQNTAVITPVGLYEYTRMPFGMRNCGNTFQRFMDQVTRGLNFCFAYVDDVLVASSSFEEHKTHMHELMRRFAHYGVVLNKDKCVFGVSEITFLGHLVTQEGIKPLPQKVEVIENFLPPTNLKQLRRFLGMVNYYRRFIPNCADTLRPLNALLSPGKPNKKTIDWTTETQKAFATIKSQLSASTLLSYPIPDAVTAIFVDASETGCGAVLQQKHGDAWKPLAFFSQTFSQAQRSYSTFDRELLAIYLAIRHFRYFVDGRQFIVYTDHAPLCHALFTRSRHSSPRQLRHLNFISQFTSDVRYIKGEDNLVSDCLSRAVGAIFGGQPATDFLAMAAAQAHDRSLTGFQTGDHSLQLEHRPISEHGVSLLGDMSTGSFRPLVPEAFRKQVFETLHSFSHPGIKHSRELISRRFVWPGMNHDIKRWCKACIPCQQSKVGVHTKSPFQRFEPVSSKFAHVHVDIVGPLPPSKGFRYILTIVDRFSRWPEAIPLPDITAQSVVDAFVLHFVGRYGAPETITTDRGRQFTSTLWHDLMTFLGTKIIHTTSYNPKANGIVERFHRVLKASLKAHTNPSDWFSNLGWVLLGIRSMVNENHPYSSSEMLYGTSLRLPGEYFHLSEKSQSPSAYIFDLRRFMKHIQPVRARVITSQLTNLPPDLSISMS